VPVAEIEITPTGGPLGAVVAGLDVSAGLDGSQVDAIRQAWLDHIVLIFRGQDLTQRDLIAFGQNFGTLHRTEGLAYGGKPDGTPPEIEIISNQPEDSVPEGARPSDEAVWHTDMSMFERPASASVLYAVEVPLEHGITRFANLYSALETLPVDLLEAVRGRRSIHDAAYTAMHEVRAGYEPPEEASKSPGWRHPVIRTHPETGREALFLGRMGYGYIEGYSVEESDRLLARLWTHMTKPEFVYGHSWRIGDVVMWDNRCCTHMRDAFDKSIRRRLLRVSVEGEVPYYAPTAPAMMQ